MKGNSIALFVLCAFITLGAGGLGGYATASEIGSWYTTLQKPSFNPPNYLFGPVWSVLYFLMAFPLYSILKQANSNFKKQLLILFSIQLLLNVMWSFLFFKFHLLGIALLEMMVLWLFILFLIARVYTINKITALMQLPYLFWVSFALILNGSLYLLN